ANSMTFLVQASHARFSVLIDDHCQIAVMKCRLPADDQGVTFGDCVRLQSASAYTKTTQLRSIEQSAEIDSIFVIGRRKHFADFQLSAKRKLRHRLRWI